MQVTQAMVRDSLVDSVASSNAIDSNSMPTLASAILIANALYRCSEQLCDIKIALSKMQLDN
jgi:hypothetical protein